MNITGKSVDAAMVTRTVASTTAASTTSNTVKKHVDQGSQTLQVTDKAPILTESTGTALDDSEETKAKVQEAVNMMNEILETNNNTSKFLYHEGLDRYYVTVVDKNTEEVIKEIPPKKLLDAFYEMQKMIGMIVDEKI